MIIQFSENSVSLCYDFKIMARFGRQLLWVVELNQKTGNMSVQTLAGAINRNTQTFLNGGSLDFIPIAVCRSAKEGTEFIKKLEAKDEEILDLQEINWDELDIQ